MILLAGGTVSAWGDAFFDLAIAWFIYATTGSPLATATIYVAISVAYVIAGLVAGPFIDRWNTRRTLVVTALIQATVVLLAALLVVGHTFHQVEALAIVLALTTASCFFAPAWMTLWPQVVPADQLVEAAALRQSVHRAIDAGARAAAGLAIAAIGVAWVFTVDAASFLFSAGSLVMARWPASQKRTTSEATGSRYFTELLAGVRVMYAIERIRWLLLLALVGNAGFVVMTPLLPALVRTQLRSGPALFGLFEAAAAVAALLGGLSSPWVLRHLGFGRLYVVARVFAAAVLMGVGWSVTPWFSVFLTGVFWFIRGQTGAPLVAMLQTEVPEAVRGRVFSVFGSLEALLMPAAMLGGGWLATRIGAGPTLMAGGAWTLLSTVIMASLPVIRRGLGTESAKVSP